MNYLGIARQENGRIVMPDAFGEGVEGQMYEVIEVGGDILLTTTPLDRRRLERIEQLTKSSIEDHRKTLDGLGR